MVFRILYVASTLSRSGPTRQLLGVVAHLDRARFEPRILTLSPEPADTLRPAFEALGVPVDTLGLSRVQLMFAGGRRVVRAVRALSPDILHTHGIRADSALAGGIGLPLHAHLATVHNDAYEDYPAAYGALVGRVMAARHIAAFRRIPQPVAVSEGIARSLAAHGVEAAVVRNGIDARAYAPASADERAALRARLGLPPDARVFVYAGVFIPRKNTVRLAQSFLDAVCGEDAMLVMLGGGPTHDDVRALLASRGEAASHVLLQGPVTNVADWYRCADVFVSASHAEGLPMAVIEALACGIPALLSDIPAHRETAELAGDGCVLFDRSVPTALADAFRRLTHEDVAQRGIAARAAVGKHFTAEGMSAAYQKLYEESRQPCLRNR
jgi:glycosyltransferase involved in cell wall biosynthesis